MAHRLGEDEEHDDTMARRSSSKRNPRPATKRHFPRTSRLNNLLQEIVADHLERIDDERLGFLTVTGVEVDADLNKAQVFISTLADESYDAETLEALEEYRRGVQADIAREARLRKTPEIVFAFDPAVRAGARIDDILATLDTADSDTGDEEPSGDAGASDASGLEVSASAETSSDQERSDAGADEEETP
ncbi:MAG: 30S ribosome-binding factor RbfA [Actinomycetota bacterium]